MSCLQLERVPPGGFWVCDLAWILDLLDAYHITHEYLLEFLGHTLILNLNKVLSVVDNQVSFVVAISPGEELDLFSSLVEISHGLVLIVEQIA